MKKFLFFLSISFYLFSRSFDNVMPSTPDEIASLNTNLLIERSVSVLSGQLFQFDEDMHIKAAQDLVLKRVYIAPQILSSYDEKEERDKYSLIYALKQLNMKGWTLLPHLWAGYNKNSPYFQVRDPSGFVLEFDINNGKGILKTSSYGCSNLGFSKPSSFVDIRNIKLKVEGKQIKIIYPDGTRRFYVHHQYGYYKLIKENLSNGKVIRYEFDEKGLVKILSTDISGKYVYACINRIGKTNYSKSIEECYKGSNGNEVTYEYEKKELEGKISQKTGKIFKSKSKRKLWEKFLVLKKAFTPKYNNISKYSDRTLLTYYDGKDYPISCDYYLNKNEIPRVKTFYTPSGKISFSYTLPKAGEKGGFSEVIYPNGLKVIYRFNSSLLLTSIENWVEEKKVNQKTFEYDKRQYISKIETSDSQGNILLTKIFECDDYGNPLVETKIGDFGKFSIKREFSKNRVISKKRDDGLCYKYTYLDDTHLVLSKTTFMNDKAIRKRVYLYDDAHNLIEEREEGKVIIKYTLYQGGKNLHRVEWEEKRDVNDNLIYKIKYSYDKYGNISREKHYGSDGNFAYEIERVYDEKGNLLEESNPLNQKAFYKYDERNRIIEEIPFSGRLKIEKFYDEKGRIIHLKENEHSSFYAYNEMDELIEEIDYLNLKTTYKYHPVHRKPIEIEKEPTFTEIIYDAFGREIERKDAYGATTKTKRNSYGDPLEIIYPDGGIQSFIYGTNRQLLKKVEPDGEITKYTYDPLGRMLTKKEGKYKTTYKYDAYNLIKAKDPLGYISFYEYNLRGQKISETRANRFIEFSYDSLGYLAEEKRAGRKISYQNDVLGRALHKNIDDLLSVSYTYDSAGNIKTISKKDTTYFFYDPFDRLVKKIEANRAETNIFYEEKDKLLIKRIVGPIPNRVEKIEVYDAHGLLVKREIPGTFLEEFKYDKALRLIAQDHLTFTYTPEGYQSSMTEAGERSTFWTYTKGGKVKSKQKPDGTIIKYEYDLEGRLIRQGSREFVYDPLGRLVSGSGFKRKLDPYGNILKEKLSNGSIIETTYDAWDRPSVRILPDSSTISYLYEGPFLKLIIRSNPNGEILYYHSFDKYDEDGNLLQETNLFTTSYFYDQTGRRIYQKSPFYEEELKYDMAGNLVQKGSSFFKYDDADQLISQSDKFIKKYDMHYNCVFDNEKNIEFDNLNQRKDLEYDLNGNLIRKGFVYDEFNQLIQTENNTYIYDAIGRRIKSDNLSYFYIDGDEIGAIENGKIKELKVTGNNIPITIEINSKPYIASVDVQNTIRNLVDWKVKKIVYENTCDAFGNGINFSIPYAYMGKRCDEDTYLIYFGKRFYDPLSNRWITKDPIGPFDHSNLYQYVYNNPFKYTDQDGQFAFAIPVVSWILGAVVSPVVLPAFGATIAVATIAWAGYEIVQAVNNICEKSNNVDNVVNNNSIQKKKKKENRNKSPNEPKKIGSRRLKPDPEAKGSHTVVKRNPHTGKIDKYSTYKPQTNPKNPNKWEEVKRFDNHSMKPHKHYSKYFDKFLESPHIHDKNFPGGVRNPEIWEIPK